MKLVVRFMVFMVCIDIIVGEKFDVVVAQDGSGDYKKIYDAVEAAPNSCKTRYTIKIKAGVYSEFVNVKPEKQNLAFIGDGADMTIINGNRGSGFLMADTPTVFIEGDHFIAKGITFNNSAGPGKNGHEGPATALRNSASFSAFYKCNFNGYQDTLFVEKGIQFFRECNIYGTVDIIYGAAAVVLQKCNIFVHNRPGSETTITAHTRIGKSTSRAGISIHNCIIKGASDFDEKSSLKTFLGRPWSDMATVVFMESSLSNIIDPRGWTLWPRHSEGTTVYYGEYKNYGKGANTNKRVRWAEPGNLNSNQAQTFTVRNLIMGDTWLPATGIPFDLDLING